MDSNKPEWRIGEGHDTHRLIEGRPLILGGITIPHSKGLDGHSDADVLLHALTDALLGAVAAGDIGELFPNTDPANLNADSRIFLEEAHRQVQQAGYCVSNLDCTLFAESPKLSPHKVPIRENLATILGLPIDCVNVKAKSGEKVGPIGRQEAISATAVVLLKKR